uniref:Uncharacterized protein n=1 Tax=Kuenenia stuttgartiensis TaxID=174633 RepID=Q1Q789_KUEST|nr:unknown protein [Candidatus Kuenenia stuttgartiensis]
MTQLRQAEIVSLLISMQYDFSPLFFGNTSLSFHVLYLKDSIFCVKLLYSFCIVPKK